MLGLSSLAFGLLLSLNVLEHLRLLALELLSLADSLVFTLLNLLNDHGSATLLCLCSQLLALVLGLQSLETLDLHHQVNALLLSEPLLLQLLVFLELFVTNGHDLGVQSHLVHVLDVVVFLIELLLGLSEETLSSLVGLDFDLGRR